MQQLVNNLMMASLCEADQAFSFHERSCGRLPLEHEAPALADRGSRSSNRHARVGRTGVAGPSQCRRKGPFAAPIPPARPPPVREGPQSLSLARVRTRKRGPDAPRSPRQMPRMTFCLVAFSAREADRGAHGGLYQESAVLDSGVGVVGKGFRWNWFFFGLIAVSPDVRGFFFPFL